MWPFVKLGLTDVWRHKTRSFLTMLGVVFGVGSVIAMLAVGEGASQQAL
ncbi:MAG: ABC transporter permease, partial [Kiritimatiellae bacterium]|nr:ABC transporter permease [Kiritimatiellia bacterium]